MKRFSLYFLCLSILTLSLIGCSETSNLPDKAGIGPDPDLTKPEPSLLSMVNIAPTEGFAEGGALWVVVNEHNEIGNGWYYRHYSYYGQHADEPIEPARPDLVAKALGRPVGVTFDNEGALLMAEDVAILRVRPASALVRL